MRFEAFVRPRLTVGEEKPGTPGTDRFAAVAGDFQRTQAGLRSGSAHFPQPEKEGVLP